MRVLGCKPPRYLVGLCGGGGKKTKEEILGLEREGKTKGEKCKKI